MTSPSPGPAPAPPPPGGGIHPYKLAVLVLGSISLLFVGFFVVGFLLPNGWTAERSVRIAAPPEAVFSYVARADGWSAWSLDPETGVELFGPAEGPGSGRRWDDPLYGRGEFTVSAATPPREVSYDVAVEDGAIRIRGIVRLEAEAGGTTVHWREEGDFGWNPLLGYLSGRMSDLQGEQMSISLGALKEAAESGAFTPARD